MRIIQSRNLLEFYDVSHTYDTYTDQLDEILDSRELDTTNELGIEFECYLVKYENEV